MSPLVYATKTDLAEYLHVDEATLPDGVDRLLERASELMDYATRGRISTTEHMEAAKKAVCAQVEFWDEAGEDRETSGPIQGFQLGRLQVQYGAGSNRIGPTYLAARARRYLLSAGLLYAGVAMM